MMKTLFRVIEVKMGLLGVNVLNEDLWMGFNDIFSLAFF